MIRTLVVFSFVVVLVVLLAAAVPVSAQTRSDEEYRAYTEFLRRAAAPLHPNCGAVPACAEAQRRRDSINVSIARNWGQSGYGSVRRVHRGYPGYSWYPYTGVLGGGYYGHSYPGGFEGIYDGYGQPLSRPVRIALTAAGAAAVGGAIGGTKGALIAGGSYLLYEGISAAVRGRGDNARWSLTNTSGLYVEAKVGRKTYRLEPGGSVDVRSPKGGITATVIYPVPGRLERRPTSVVNSADGSGWEIVAPGGAR